MITTNEIGITRCLHFKISHNLQGELRIEARISDPWPSMQTRNLLNTNQGYCALHSTLGSVVSADSNNMSDLGALKLFESYVSADVKNE
jgi:hypothetical protein